jgi:hypothetical protein
MRNGARLDLSWPDSDADLAVAALPACQLAGRAAATCCCFGSSTQKRLQRTHIGQSSQDGNQPSYRESIVQSEDWAEDSCYLVSKRTPLLPPQSHWSSGGPLSPVRNTRVSLATFDSSSCASNFPAAVSSSLPPKHKPDSDGAQASAGTRNSRGPCSHQRIPKRTDSALAFKLLPMHDRDVHV